MLQLIILIALSSDAFIQAKNASNPLSAGALRRTPLEELTTLPQTPSRLGRGCPIPLPLEAFGALNSVPNCFRIFMATLF